MSDENVETSDDGVPTITPPVLAGQIQRHGSFGNGTNGRRVVGDGAVRKDAGDFATPTDESCRHHQQHQRSQFQFQFGADAIREQVGGASALSPVCNDAASDPTPPQAHTVGVDVTAAVQTTPVTTGSTLCECNTVYKVRTVNPESKSIFKGLDFACCDKPMGNENRCSFWKLMCPIHTIPTSKTVTRAPCDTANIIDYQCDGSDNGEHSVFLHQESDVRPKRGRKPKSVLQSR
jgi:hypothetical protein